MSRPNNNPHKLTVFSKDGHPFKKSSIGQAIRLIDTEQAYPCTCDGGEVPGWRERNDYTLRYIRMTVDFASRNSRACITRGEMEANAEGGSRTLGLSPAVRAKINEGRAARGLRPLPEEDFAEQAINKVSAWPHERDRKAVLVGPRVSA